MPVTPVNYRKQKASLKALRTDAQNAIQVADSYVERIPGGGDGLLGKRVLEVGPGASLGTSVVLACYGASVTVADKYLAFWDPDYHQPFYEMLLILLGGRGPAVDPQPIYKLLTVQDFSPDVLTRFEGGAEQLGRLAGDEFDFVLSNAVLEHVEDVPRSLANLARVTAPGGLNLHQIDFRDHRNFDRPLEYLTMSVADFDAIFVEQSGECGNRWRHTQFNGMFEEVGFEITGFTPNVFATDTYIANVTPRLHADQQRLVRDELRILSGCFECTKPVRERAAKIHTEFPVRGDDPQTLAHCASRYAVACPLAAGRRVLDVGCGAGLGTAQLVEADAASVEGIDRSDEALELTRRDPALAGVAFRKGDLEQKLPYDDASFDLVVALEILEHVERQTQLIAQIHRVLTDDGLAVISVPYKPFEEFWTAHGAPNPYHVHVPDHDEFRTLLGAFATVEIFAQTDFAVSVLLPLGATDGPVTIGELRVPQQVAPVDRGTITVLAVCRKRTVDEPATHRPIGFAYGNYQRVLAEARLLDDERCRELRLLRNAHSWQRLEIEPWFKPIRALRARAGLAP